MATVTVGCKIPSGITLMLYDANQPSVIVWRHVLQGCAVDMVPFVREHAAGLTHGVNQECWDEWESWAKENKLEPYMKGLIFASARTVNTTAEAKEKANEKSGLEGLGVPMRPGDKISDPRLAILGAASAVGVPPGSGVLESVSNN